MLIRRAVTNAKLKQMPRGHTPTKKMTSKEAKSSNLLRCHFHTPFSEEGCASLFAPVIGRCLRDGSCLRIRSCLHDLQIVRLQLLWACTFDVHLPPARC